MREGRTARPRNPKLGSLLSRIARPVTMPRPPATSGSSPTTYQGNRSALTRKWPWSEWELRGDRGAARIVLGSTVGLDRMRGSLVAVGRRCARLSIEVVRCRRIEPRAFAQGGLRPRARGDVGRV